MTDEIKTSAEVMEAAALPRLREVHADPNATELDANALKGAKPVSEKSPAEWAYQRLVLYIQNFEKQLDAEHEVAMVFHRL